MEKKRTRIKIKDLPKDQKISKEELKRIKGGAKSLSPFIKIVATPGESTDHEHKDWIELC